MKLFLQGLLDVKSGQAVLPLALQLLLFFFVFVFNLTSLKLKMDHTKFKLGQVHYMNSAVIGFT